MSKKPTGILDTAKKPKYYYTWVANFNTPIKPKIKQTKHENN